MKVSILGTTYTILSQEELKGDADGLCESYSKELVVKDFKEDSLSFNNLDEYRKKVLRHEIVHAFLHESGLAFNCEWAKNEELVDWIALQFPKILKAFNDTKCL